MSSIVTPSTYTLLEISTLYDIFSLALAVTLLILLIYKEILMFSRRVSQILSRRALNVVIVPFIIVFFMIALVNLANI
jgi:hypothetical protein